MTIKRAGKKPPAKKAGARPKSTEIPDGDDEDPFFANINARRPFEFSDVEWQVINGSVRAWMKGMEEGRSADASQLLRMCAAFLRAGVAPPEPASSWLANRIDSIGLMEMPWGVALVSRKAGQKGADEQIEQMIAASLYDQYRREGNKALVASRMVIEKLDAFYEGLTGTKIENWHRKFYGQAKP